MRMCEGCRRRRAKMAAWLDGWLYWLGFVRRSHADALAQDLRRCAMVRDELIAGGEPERVAEPAQADAKGR